MNKLLWIGVTIFFVSLIHADPRPVNKSDVILQQLPNTSVQLSESNNIPSVSEKRSHPYVPPASRSKAPKKHKQKHKKHHSHKHKKHHN
jgi:hypothetical protein